MFCFNSSLCYKHFLLETNMDMVDMVKSWPLARGKDLEAAHPGGQQQEEAAKAAEASRKAFWGGGGKRSATRSRGRMRWARCRSSRSAGSRRTR